MRNPWSFEKYNGPWSDQSKEWTAAYKAQVGGLDVNKYDGKFWMTIEIYKKVFHSTSIAFYDNYQGYTSVDVNYKGKQKYYTLTNPVDQEGYVVLDTYSNRNYPRASKCKPNTQFGLFLYSGSTLLERTSTYYYGFGTIGEPGKIMKAGTYKIMLYNWTPNDMDANLQVYGLKAGMTITE